MTKRKELVLIIVGLIFLLIAITGIAYAAFSYSKAGEISLTKGENLYIYVGEQPFDHQGGYNGGSSGWEKSYDGVYRGGGGATDIRLTSGTWNDTASLASRLMVAGGGAGSGYYATYYLTGGDAGGLVGGIGMGRVAGKPPTEPLTHTLTTGGDPNKWWSW